MTPLTLTFDMAEAARRHDAWARTIEANLAARKQLCAQKQRAAKHGVETKRSAA